MIKLIYLCFIITSSAGQSSPQKCRGHWLKQKYHDVAFKSGSELVLRKECDLAFL